MPTANTHDWPGGDWEGKLAHDLDEWKPVHEVLADLAQRAGAAPIDCPDDPKKLLMVPLAAGMTIREAFLHAAACCGYAVKVAGGKITLREGDKGTIDTWVAAIGGEIWRIDFADVHGMVIAPRGKKSGPMAWVWYAPSQGIWECNAWITKRLLDQGMALAMVDVGESGGSPKGRAIYQRFYERLVKEHGMAGKPVLWPQSRGGLMLYNWAAEHAELVQAVGGTYTVCNLEEWATSKVPGIMRLFELALQDYGLTAEELRGQMGRHNPVDRLVPLVRAGIPVFHVHGDQDVVVPVEENAGDLVKRYKALGGKAELMMVPGKGHEVVAEFFRCPALADFLVGQAKLSL